MKYDDITTNRIWRTAAILKIVFGYISTIYRPINAKFGKKKYNHVQKQVTWPKYQISKIQGGERPPFWKCFFRYNSAENHPISTKCCVQMQIFVPITATSQNIKILQIQYGGRPPYWKSFFFGICQQFIFRLTRNLAWRSKIKLDTGDVTKMPI